MFFLPSTLGEIDNCNEASQADGIGFLQPFLDRNLMRSTALQYRWIIFFVLFFSIKSSSVFPPTVTLYSVWLRCGWRGSGGAIVIHARQHTQHSKSPKKQNKKNMKRIERKNFIKYKRPPRWVFSGTILHHHLHSIHQPNLKLMMSFKKKEEEKEEHIHIYPTGLTCRVVYIQGRQKHGIDQT
jgi:hypothetical protein